MKPRRPSPALLAALTALAAAASSACSGTGQPEIAYEAYAVATPPGAITAGDFTVTLDEAVIAFGPAYFCAASSGSATLCETAVAELTQIVAIDALDPSPQPLGEVRGFTGQVRSVSYDYGVHWLLTESSPVAAPAAPGGHSARFRGRAVNGDTSIEFLATIDVLAQFQGQRAVPTAPASASIGEEGARLEVQVDIGPWLAAVDWSAAAASPERPYSIDIGSPEHNAVVIAMVSAHPPKFVWTAPR